MPTHQCRDCGRSADEPLPPACPGCGGPFVAWAPAPAATPPDDAERRQFWRQGMTRCVRCGGDVVRDHDVENCRMDGDAYGTDRFFCVGCGWETSFLFDEASSPYYFETFTWTR